MLRHQDWEAARIFSDIGFPRPLGRLDQDRLDRSSRKEKRIVLIVQITYLDVSLLRATILHIVDERRPQAGGDPMVDPGWRACIPWLTF